MGETIVSHYDGMLNAGFCAVIITAMAEGAASVQQEGRVSLGLPWIAAYLLVPLALYPRSSASIKKSRHRGLAAFMNAHPELAINLERRIAYLTPYVRSGLVVAFLHNSIQLDKSRRNLIAIRESSIDQDPRVRELLSHEDLDCIKASGQLGKWAVQSTVAQICSALLVRPIWTRLLQTDSSIALAGALPDGKTDDAVS